MEHIITAVQPDSIAAEAGIEAGDVLLCIDKLDITDVFDYLDYCAHAVLDLGIRDVRTQKVRTVHIEKEEWEELGLEFSAYLMSEQRRCQNKCVFCFEDQLPSDARCSLKAKDDDWRMSIIAGNFVTLTNVSQAELARIVERKAFPLFISVHAMGQKRVDMMGNPNAGRIQEQLTYLAQNGISFHAQIVLCPGYNDGEVLTQTVQSLFAFWPYALSVAVVPVGLTAHRAGLAKLSSLTQEQAAHTIHQIHEMQKTCKKQGKTRFVFASDELYCIAKHPLPSFAEYEEFCQLENGVGLMRLFEDQLEDALADCEKQTAKGDSFALITGCAAQDWLRAQAARVAAHTGAKLTVYPIVNGYFGNQVDVAGLVTGSDIAAQFQHDGSARVLIPDCMLKADEDIFLDGMTLDTLSNLLQTKIEVVPVDGQAFLDTIGGNCE